MKHYTEKVIPARTLKVEEYTTCDMCGGKCETTSCYDVEDVEISCETGNAYPEGRFTTTTSCDLCVDCFEQKLVPWLVSQGVKMTKTESD